MHVYRIYHVSLKLGERGHNYTNLGDIFILQVQFICPLSFPIL